jgi:hypothetical protein
VAHLGQSEACFLELTDEKSALIRVYWGQWEPPKAARGWFARWLGRGRCSSLLVTATPLFQNDAKRICVPIIGDLHQSDAASFRDEGRGRARTPLHCQ